MYEVVTTHTARKTFIGNMYKKVKDPDLVSSVSGHKEGSKAFRRYREIDEEMKQKLNEMHVGRLIHILSHTMKRHNPAEVMENDDLTTMQKHVLKFILLETMHRDLYQKDIEEEFQIRKPTVTGILKLMEKNGYIYRESAKQDARLKQIIPTEKAEKIRPAILKSIEEGEAKMLRGIPKEDVELCKQVLWQMYENRKKSCDSRNDF